MSLARVEGAFCVTGRIVDVVAGRIYAGEVRVENGRIAAVEEHGQGPGTYIVPGFVDAHVHVESSLLSPTEFARAAMCHGTVASVSDPHEIANVLGVAGVLWMVEEGRRTPFKFHFGAPSCVPATPFETAGARFRHEEVARLLGTPGVGYLAEVMNFPAVIAREPGMMAIVEEARRRGLVIDGHAPGVMGDDLRRYAEAGISSDHECSSEEEGRARLEQGMKLAIREGSAARNFDALIGLAKEFPEACFLCSDDKHPDELLIGHIDRLCARAVKAGIPIMDVLRMASLNPVRHYNLPVGLLQVGDPADFLELESLESFRVTRAWINGVCVAEEGRPRLERQPVKTVNHFIAGEKRPEDFRKGVTPEPQPVIIALDGQIVTARGSEAPRLKDGYLTGDTERDLLLLTVVNRYEEAPPALALVKGFGLQRGALASSVAHDSHNVVGVGVDPESLCRAVNAVVLEKGGLAAVGPEETKMLPLPIAGLMSDGSYEETARAYEELVRYARKLGCPMHSAFMTLSFLALLVIPRLKLSDKGLFDVERFRLVEA